MVCSSIASFSFIFSVFRCFGSLIRCGLPARMTGLPRFRRYKAQANAMASHNPPAPSIAPASILVASPHPYPAHTKPGRARAMARQSAIKEGMAHPHFLRVRRVRRVPLHPPGIAGKATFCLASYGFHKLSRPKGRVFRVDMSHPSHIPMRVRTSHSFRPPFHPGRLQQNIPESVISEPCDGGFHAHPVIHRIANTVDCGKVLP